jgi:PAS domain S-box-containing protein
MLDVIASREIPIRRRLQPPMVDSAPPTPAPVALADRVAIAIIALYAVLAVPLIAVATEPGPALPGFNAFFAAGVFVAELATSYLLLIWFGWVPRWSTLLLAAAYLFSALMSVPYLLVFPGAVRDGAPLLGTPQSIAYVFLFWFVGYPLLATASVVVEAWWSGARPARPERAAALMMTTTLAVVALGAVVAVGYGESLPRMVEGDTWTPLNAALNYLVPPLLAAAIALILLRIRSRNELFLWLAIALTTMMFGALLSTVGGSRYTVGWYAWRISWLVSACTLFLYFMGHFWRQHGLLTQARDDLAERTRERDRIWAVSEDLLGVSNFEGYFVALNPAWTRLFGWSEAEIRRMHVSELRHPDDAAAAFAGRAQLAQGMPTVRVENRFRHKDGSWRWIAWTMTAHEGLIYVAGRHVTAERQAQEMLRRAQEARAQRQKMEALGQLTGGVAHDFNNLLMIVSGHMARLKKAVAADPKATRAAEAIETAAHRGQSLTRQLLGFARRQPVNPVVVDPAAAIAAMQPMLASSVGAAAELVMEIAPDLAALWIDENEFELALINLVLNARDAVAREDTITVSARNVRLMPGMTPENLAGDFVAVSVADTGAGIAADVLPRVFEPFFTTKAGDKGAGLGLAQVHGFAQRSGGAVTIDSDVGEGTVVTLYLPRTDALPKRAAPEPATAIAGGSALLVEDNPAVAEASRDMLADLGFAVHIAHDALGALALIAHRDFDLVVSDIVMPGRMNGAELARVIRTSKPRLPIILVTGYAGPASGTAADFLVLRKPYLADDMRRAIAQVTRRVARA